MTLSNDTKRIIKEAYGVILRNAFKNDTLNRDIEPLVHFVEKSGFFKARSFSHHHYSGGAAQHCMEVMLWSLEKRHPESISSWVIVTLLHDLCNTYGFTGHGHDGSKSVYMIEECAGFPLTDDEREAILYHMMCDMGKLPVERQNNIKTNNPFWRTLKRNDCRSAAQGSGEEPLSEEEFCKMVNEFLERRSWK